MKYIKILVIIVFVISLAAYGLSVGKDILSYDSSVPEITSDREILEVTCDYTQEQLLEGLQAFDDKDGDLTSQILIGGSTRFIEKGVFNLTYVVFDSSNQSASLTRKVRLTDYESPQFSLTAPLVYRESEGNYQESLDRIGITDMLDGDLKEWLTQIDSDVNYSKAGTYHMTMEGSNRYGDTVTLEIPVHIVDEETHNIDINLSQGIVYVNQGTELTGAEWLVSVSSRGGNLLDTSLVNIDSQVDTSTPGTYEIHYSVDDGSGSVGETWLTVVVKE